MDIDGKIHAKNLREKIKKEIIDLKEKLKKNPQTCGIIDRGVRSEQDLC